jgi:hypothetical protein
VKYIEVEQGSDEHLAVVRECRKQAIKPLGIHPAAAHLVRETFALDGTDIENIGWTVEYDEQPHPEFDGVANKTILVRVEDRIAAKVDGKNLDVPNTARKVKVRALAAVEPPEYDTARKAKQAEAEKPLKEKAAK